MTPRNMEDPMTALAVQMAIPDAAKLRTRSCIIADEWNVPIRDYHNIGNEAGVALVPKQALAEVMQRVGYTANPVAIVITQEPDNFGLKGYHRPKVSCTISAMADSGNRVSTTVTRFLVQFGFGEQVHQIMVGDNEDNAQFWSGDQTGSNHI